MHILPLLYFLILTLYLWNKNKVFDLAVYMSSLFTITSLCSELMILFDQTEGSGVLADGWKMEFGFIPTILYCALITITIIPFSFIRVEKLQRVTSSRRYVLYVLTLLIILQCLVMILLVSTCINDLLTNNLKDLKNLYYSGDLSPLDTKMLQMPFPIRILFLTSSITIFALPLFFYFTCIEKRNVFVCSPLIIASMTNIFKGLVIADRTEMILWGLMLIFCIVLFRNMITRQVKRISVIFGIPLTILALFYFIAVSSARFDTKDETGASNSILMYAGQSYVNFCYFYDNHNPDLYSFEREFPITSMVLFKSTYTDTKGDRSAKEGFFIGVFASHVGSWLIDSGIFGAIIFSFAFAFVCILVIRKYDRREFSMEEVFLIFVLGTVPTFGIFYYRYYHHSIALQYLVAITLYIFAQCKIILYKPYHKEQVI